MKDTKNTLQPSSENGLVDAPRLLETLFPDARCRPRLRWLRKQQQLKTIPFIKLGRLVYFYPADVREALRTRHTVGGMRGGKSNLN